MIAFYIIHSPICILSLQQAFKAMRNLNIKPNKETFHLLMIAHASSGDTKGTAKVFQKYLSYDFELSTVVMNINLASLLYSDDDFNWEVFSMLYKRFYESGEVKSDRFTYTQLLIACGKAGKTDLAIKYFEEVLGSKEIKLSVALRNTFQEAIGNKRYDEWKSKLNSKDQYLLFNAIDTTPKKITETELEGKIPIRKIPPSQSPSQKYIPTGYRDLSPKRFEGLTGFQNSANHQNRTGAVPYKPTSPSSVAGTQRKIFNFHKKSVVYAPPEEDSY